MEKIKKKKNVINRDAPISWALHALKNVLGYEDIRKKIIKKYYPDIDNAKYIRTFDATVSYNPTNYKEKYAEKINDILNYCKSIMNLTGYVVFTATNIEEYRDETQEKDNETHYQMFIVDNENHKLYAIDPALKPGNKKGIYVPQIALDIINPFFKKNGYKTQFVQLTNPAQTDNSEEHADVFCQSWTLYILFELLKKKHGHDFKDIDVNIPKDQLERYKILLQFYKNLLKTVPSIKKILNEEYVSELNEYKPHGYSALKELKASRIIMSITPEEL